MSQPIYFLPNLDAKDLVKQQRLHPPAIAAAGLTEVFADVARDGDDFVTMEWRSKGPGGKSGVFLCYLKENATRDLPQHWGHYEQQQKWILRTPGLPTSAYIGWNPDQPPTPEDLRRRKLHPGYVLELGDGQCWQVPIIHRPDDTTELPCHMYLGDDGQLREEIKAAWKECFDELAIVCTWLENLDKPDTEVGFSKEKAFRLAVRSLAANYRLGHAEQRIVQAVDRENFMSILAAAVDWRRFRAVDEAAKKKPPP